jgi:hypothetical protein
MSQRQLPIILALDTSQTLAWASSYYLPAQAPRLVPLRSLHMTR